MIIESAFFKLPRVLHKIESLLRTEGGYGREKPSRKVYEAELNSLFATLLRQEITLLNMPSPNACVVENFPYEIDTNKKVDIYVNLHPDLSRVAEAIKASQEPQNFLPIWYGTPVNYIESKYFGNLTSKGSSTQQVGKILNDILRLKSLIRSKENISRYLLLVFAAHPEKYLAYSNRKWLEELLIPKMKEFDLTKPKPLTFGHIRIPLKQIPDSMFKEVKEGFEEKTRGDDFTFSFFKYFILPYTVDEKLKLKDLSYFFLMKIF